MNTDTVKQLCDEALGRLTTALEQGHSDALKTYLATIVPVSQVLMGNVRCGLMSHFDALRHLAEALVTLPRYGPTT